MAEDYGLSPAPVFVIDLRTVFCLNFGQDYQNENPGSFILDQRVHCSTMPESDNEVEEC